MEIAGLERACGLHLGEMIGLHSFFSVGSHRHRCSFLQHATYFPESTVLHLVIQGAFGHSLREGVYIWQKGLRNPSLGAGPSVKR